MTVLIVILPAALLLAAILLRASLVAGKSSQQRNRMPDTSLESSAGAAPEAPNAKPSAYDPEHRRTFASTQAETPMARARASSVEDAAGQPPPNKANGA